MSAQDLCSLHCGPHGCQTELREGSMVQMETTKFKGDSLLGSGCVGQGEEILEPNGTEKNGGRKRKQQALRFKDFSLFDLSVLLPEKMKTRLVNQFPLPQISQCLMLFSWASGERNFTAALQYPLHKSNDHHNKKSVLMIDINLSCCNFNPFPPRNVLCNWEINKGVKH